MAHDCRRTNLRLPQDSSWLTSTVTVCPTWPEKRHNWMRLLLACRPARIRQHLREALHAPRDLRARVVLHWSSNFFLLLLISPPKRKKVGTSVELHFGLKGYAEPLSGAASYCLALKSLIQAWYFPVSLDELSHIDHDVLWRSQLVLQSWDVFRWLRACGGPWKQSFSTGKGSGPSYYWAWSSLSGWVLWKVLLLQIRCTNCRGHPSYPP